MYKVFVLTLLQLLLSFSVHAEGHDSDVTDEKLSTWLWNYLTVGASVTAGIGGRSIAIDVKRDGTDGHGKILENRENEFFLLYSTKAGYFGGSNIGYAWLFNLSTLHLNEQEQQDGTIVNLGTEVDGYFAYTVPTIFYNFGDRYRGHYFRTGIGLGIGMAEFKGDIVLTESTQANDRVGISNGRSNIFFALGVFIDYQWQNFTVRLSTAGPNLEYSGYEMNVSDSSLVFGYTYYLK